MKANQMEEKKQEIASRLSLARKQIGLSQSQVAKMLNMSRPTISEIEAGRRSVTAEELVEFSNIYKVEIKWLSCIDDTANTLVDKLSLQFRELEKLKKEDFDKVISILQSLKSNN
ncbi:MAG: helix-turn-helix transcriptional regulator [Bacteroidetes bacterium]|nr:helix-turn-helix transcriptional regulator [Bacteroidota bacterium]